MAEKKEASKAEVVEKKAEPIAEPGTGVTSFLSSALNTALSTAKDLNETYQVTAQARALAEATQTKAKEIDEKYQISQQSKVVIDSALQTVQDYDDQLQITATTKKVAGEIGTQLKSVDDQLGVTATVKSTITSVDEKMGISKKVKEVDSQYQISNKLVDVVGDAKNALLGNTTYTGVCFMHDRKTELIIAFGAQRKTAHVFLKFEQGEMTLPILPASKATAGENSSVSIADPIPQIFTFENEGEAKSFQLSYNKTVNSLPKPVQTEGEKKEEIKLKEETA